MPETIRRKQRVLSRFLCQELLYDFMTERLDNDRKKSVERFLQEDSDLQSELKAMTSAVAYCEGLSKTKLSDDLVNSLSHTRLPTEILAEKVSYRNWPDILKWSTEAAVISICVAGLAIVMPWDSIRGLFENPVSSEVILADVSKKIEESAVNAPDIEMTDTETSPKPATEDTTVSGDALVDAITTVAAPTPVPAPKASPTPAAARADAPKTASGAAKAVAATKPLDKRAAQPQGLLYRIMMNHADTKNIAPEIRDKIIELGGKKAGQVEIGWRKSNGNYFHVSLPEKEYQNFITTLGSYGPVRIYKNPHVRVMPPGIIRIILWIEDIPGAEPSPEKTESAEVESVPQEMGESAPESALEEEQ